MTRKSARTRLARRLAGASLAVTLAGVAGLAATPAHAVPRDDMRGAYAQALQQFNDLEVEKALQIINDGITAATQAGAGEDPVLASLYLMRAALTYSTQGDEARDAKYAAWKRAVAATLTF